MREIIATAALLLTASTFQCRAQTPASPVSPSSPVEVMWPGIQAVNQYRAAVGNYMLNEYEQALKAFKEFKSANADGFRFPPNDFVKKLCAQVDASIVFCEKKLNPPVLIPKITGTNARDFITPGRIIDDGGRPSGPGISGKDLESFRRFQAEGLQHFQGTKGVREGAPNVRK